MGVASTNALELGIDVGSLDAAIIVGFPGTIASTWQQAGRAGRASDESLAVLVGYNDPIDQYLMRHGDYFFRQSPENAVIDPENQYILAKHLQCAAFELPLTEMPTTSCFGEMTEPIVELLEEFERAQGAGRAPLLVVDRLPRARRSVSGRSRTTPTRSSTSQHDNTVIGVVDGVSARSSSSIRRPSICTRARPTSCATSTSSRRSPTWRRRRSTTTRSPCSSRPSGSGETTKRSEWSGNRVFFGDATVTWLTSAFKKIKFYQLDSIGWCNLDLPPFHLETEGALVHPGQGGDGRGARGGAEPGGGAGRRAQHRDIGAAALLDV